MPLVLRTLRPFVSTAVLAAVLAVPTAPADATSPPRSPIRVNTTVGQADGGRTDIVRVRLPGTGAEGAVTTLYRRVDERNVRVASAALDAAGTAEFRTRDLNGRRITRYFVTVAPTESSLGRRGPVKQVR